MYQNPIANIDKLRNQTNTGEDHLADLENVVNLRQISYKKNWFNFNRSRKCPKNILAFDPKPRHGNSTYYY